MNTPLQHAVWAVIARWESPAWKDMPHTGEYIDAMRKALADEQAQAVEAMKATPEDMEIYRGIAKQAQAAVPATEPLSNFDMRGVLASNLLCWHRLTDAEAQNLICFFEKVKAQQVAVPAGWALVPIEPTEEELANGVRAMRLFVTKNSLIDFSLGYKAMLAAAQGAKP